MTVKTSSANQKKQKLHKQITNLGEISARDWNV